MAPRVTDARPTATGAERPGARPCCSPAVFLALSLAGYDPADPPGLAAEPPNAPPANPCGPVGATLAHVLFTALGLVVVPGPARRSPSSTCCCSAAGRSPSTACRLLGFALVLAVAAALVQRFAPGLEPSPPVGSGGYLGAVEVDVPRRPVRAGRDVPDPRRRRAVGPGALLRRPARLAGPGARPLVARLRPRPAAATAVPGTCRWPCRRRASRGRADPVAGPRPASRLRSAR